MWSRPASPLTRRAQHALVASPALATLFACGALVFEVRARVTKWSCASDEMICASDEMQRTADEMQRTAWDASRPRRDWSAPASEVVQKREGKSRDPRV
eukprot:6209475-Pleurochrysis_carterae.AAC.1